MARLDRLGPAKEVAQIGAAIGREFSHALLAAVVRKPEAELYRHSTVSLRLVCCSGRACRRMRPICSSMPWCRTRPMARCCAEAQGASSADRIRAPAGLARVGSPVSQRCWRIIVPRAA